MLAGLTNTKEEPRKLEYKYLNIAVIFNLILWTFNVDGLAWKTCLDEGTCHPQTSRTN